MQYRTLQSASRERCHTAGLVHFIPHILPAALSSCSSNSSIAWGEQQSTIHFAGSVWEMVYHCVSAHLPVGNTQCKVVQAVKGDLCTAVCTEGGLAIVELQIAALHSQLQVLVAAQGEHEQQQG